MTASTSTTSQGSSRRSLSSRTSSNRSGHSSEGSTKKRTRSPQTSSGDTQSTRSRRTRSSKSSSNKRFRSSRPTSTNTGTTAIGTITDLPTIISHPKLDTVESFTNTPTRTLKDLSWRETLQGTYDTATEFESAVSHAKSSFMSGTSDFNRYRFPRALIDMADRHLIHASDLDKTGWSTALSSAVSLGRSLQLSRHYTGLAASERPILPDSLSVDTFAKTQGLDTDVVSGWREIWDKQDERDMIYETCRDGKGFDRKRVLQLSDEVDNHWVLRGLESVSARPGSEVVPLWWGQSADGTVGVEVSATG